MKRNSNGEAPSGLANASAGSVRDSVWTKAKRGSSGGAGGPASPSSRSQPARRAAAAVSSGVGGA